MQKRKCVFVIIILILVSIYSGRSTYCNAQIKQDNPYLEFEQLVRNKQYTKAITIGDALFERLVSKYPANAGLHDLHGRLKVAQDLIELIRKGLESRQKMSLEDIISLDILPEFPPTGNDQGQANYFLPPAEQLYWTYQEPFSYELKIQKVSYAESKFLLGYYDIKIQSWIKEIVNIVTHLIVTNPQSSHLSYYSFVLPLLYLCEEDPGWNKPDSLLALIGSDNLDVMLDFCLLRVDRPEAALTIAKYKAISQGKSFPVVEWALAAGTKCIENHRPDLAERLLTGAIDTLDDKEKVVELRLKVVEGYGECGDNATAAKKCGQITKDFPNSSLYGKVTSSYFAYIAKQSQPEQILAEIDSALQSRQCQRYLPQLMYLKWWALHKTNQQILAKKTGEKLIENHGSCPCIAPVLLVLGTDALSNQQYEKCQQLLVQLTRNFPQTNSAKQAQKILVRLDNK
jgi:hypothetical protein